MEDYIAPSIPPYTFSMDNNIKENHTYQSFIDVNNDGNPIVISSATRTAVFIYPYLYGLSDNDDLNGSGLYNNLTKLIQPKGNRTINLVGNVKFIYFCYPAIYGELTSILNLIVLKYWEIL